MSRHLDARDIRERLAERMPALAERLLGKPSSVSRYELRFGRKGSMSVAIAGRKAGTWGSFEEGIGGDAISLIQRVHGLDFPGALRWAAEWLGDPSSAPPPPMPNRKAPVDDSEEVDKAKLVARALKLWDEAVPITDSSPVAIYLARRIGERADYDRSGEVLRYHPRLLYRPKNGSCEYLPGMVALWRNIVSNEPVGIHRTYLRPNGARVDKVEKKSLGSAFEAAIKLDADDTVTLGLSIAEGIEKSEVWRAIGIRPMWVVNGEGGIAKFPILKGVALTVFADHDISGGGLLRAQKCRQRWIDAGEPEPRIFMPNEAGRDIDELIRRVA